VIKEYLNKDSHEVGLEAAIF